MKQKPISLHEPIKYKIRFFHYAASMTLNRILEAMELMPGELEQSLPDKESNVLPINKD